MEKITEKDIIKIIDLYLNQKLSIEEISHIYLVDKTTIFRKLKKNDIEIRKTSKKSSEELKETNRLYSENKRKDSLVKFTNTQINAVWDTLIPERAGVKNLFSVLLYPFEVYKTYIENLFEEGMNWDNYGEWVIEHMIPQSHFIFNNINDTEYKKCWNLKNLKPVWIKDMDGDIVNNHLYHDNGSDIEIRKHKYIITNSEKIKIVKQYKNGSSIDGLASKYKIGKLKIKEILNENNVEKNIKENLSEIAKASYKKEREINLPLEGKIFIAVCKETGKEYKDYLNKSGSLSEHIWLLHNIEAPNNHFKRKYFLENKKHWFEEFFNIIEVNEKETRPCKYCDWVTYDLINKTGCYENHLIDAHDITINQHLINFPEEIKFQNTTQLKKDREIFLSDINNFVICKICNEKMKIINHTHLKIHNISVEDYKNLYGFDIQSNTTNKLFIKNYKIVNENMVPTWESKSEKEIKEYIISLGFNATKNRKLLKGQEIDILIEDKKLAIEFNGNKWHTEVFGKKSRQYHLDKTKNLTLLNYKLIQIFEDEWFMKQEIIKSKLKHILGASDSIKIGARKCLIKLISKPIANRFLENYHIQGLVNSDIYLGAFYKDELIAVMTFGEKRNMTNSKIKYEWELTRFVTHQDYTIAGIASKLLTFFIKENNPESIISFADRRWSDDINPNLYEKLGFIKTGYTFPNYWYYNNKVDRYKRFHRFGFGLNNLKRKNMYIEGMSEWECMQHHGWDRIWDCGLIRYVWNKD